MPPSLEDAILTAKAMFSPFTSSQLTEIIGVGTPSPPVNYMCEVILKIHIKEKILLSV